MSPGIRVVVAGDSPSLLRTLAACIQELEALHLVGTANPAETAPDIIRDTACDVVLVELGSGETDGLAVTQSLLEDWPGLGVIVVPAKDPPDRIIEAIEVGARGWVSAISPSLLANAIQGVAQGESRFPADALREVLVARMRTDSRQGGDAGRELTLRELDVLGCLADGLTRAQISQVLHLSPNTVRTYVRNILRKLHVHSSAAAVALAGRSERPEPPRGLQTEEQARQGATADVNSGPISSGGLALAGSTEAPR